MILAESLAMANRNDNDKQVKIDLQKCFTKGCCVKEKKFPQEMARIRQKVMESQLLRKPVSAEIQYLERSKRFQGTLFRIIKTKDGDRIRNINRWMIQLGLSYYIVDKGRSPHDKDFSKAQDLARKKKSGGLAI